MTYYEFITEVMANDEKNLKKYLQARFSESCAANDSWLNASSRYGTASGWKMTPEFMSAWRLAKEWDYCQHKMITPGTCPVVVLFKPPRGKKYFSSVRVKDKHGALVWELDEAKTVFTNYVYAGLVPPECEIEFADFDAKYLDPEILGVPKSEPEGELSMTNESSGGSVETTTRQPRAVDEMMGETTPRQPGAVDEQWVEGDQTPRQLAGHADFRPRSRLAPYESLY